MVDLKRQNKNSKAILAVLAVVIVLLILCVVFTHKTSSLISGADDSNLGAGVTESSETPGGDDGQEPLTVSVNIAKHYATHTGDPGNLYHIDGNHVLWGSGNNTCGQLGQGTQDDEFYSENVKIAENVIMVWTDFAVDGYPQPGAKERAMAWTGKLKYDTEYENIAELGEVYPGFLNNTVIQKADGSYWVCGENVGTKEKVIPGEEGHYSAICSYEFYPCE